MKYTTKERRAMAAAYRKALAYLPKDGDTSRSEFICHALETAHELNLITLETYLECRRLINKRLGKHLTLQGWLVAKRHATDGALFMDRCKNNMRKMQATRVAWLRSLIKEFSK